ncbi:MAG: endonuclease/exonuclease/phosphatase family protein [Kiritimatiellia bacterium]
MKRLGRLSAVAVGLACLGAGGADVEPLELTYVQWNIGHFALGKAPATTIAPADAPARAREYRALLDVLRPDILGLSEYETAFDTAGTPSARAVFADFSATVGPRNDWQWNATLVRPGIEVLATECMDYPKRYQRTYALISRCRAKGVDFTIVQTHLDWDCDGRLGRCHTNRQDQIRCLIERFAATPRVIISGDFNINSRREYAAFTAAGYTSVNYGEWGELLTFRQVEPNHDFGLDNILVKGFDCLVPFTADPAYRLSDHLPLCVRLRAKPAAACSRPNAQ